MNTEKLNELRALRESLYPEVARPFRLFEPKPSLDVGARRGDRLRTFKYLHQMCLGQMKNFIATNKCKQLSLLDGYLQMDEAENPYGVFMFGRSAIELCAFLHETSQRLYSAKSLAAEQWENGGQKFFNVAVRSRFATNLKHLQEVLVGEGVTAKNLDPLNVMRCLESLSQRFGYSDTLERYSTLCDYLHHNLGSATLANAGSGSSMNGVDEKGQHWITREATGMTEYVYPTRRKAFLAVEATCEGFLKDMGTCLELITGLPETPYSPEQILEFTGTTHGGGTLAGVVSRPVGRQPTVGRNDVCPCGSGKKYKRCCGN